jgi:hypothetical protein
MRQYHRAIAKSLILSIQLEFQGFVKGSGGESGTRPLRAYFGQKPAYSLIAAQSIR